MNGKSRRASETSHKKGANRNESAVKHAKLHDTHPRDTDKDIREDRGIRKQKLGRRHYR